MILRALALAWLLGAAPAPSDGPTIDLARAAWQLDGRAPPSAPQLLVIDGATHVALPLAARGTRWSTQLDAGPGATYRLLLDARGGPDGLLLEVVLDGARLRPVHDTWRPSAGPLRLDLGPTWLGPGPHLLEFVAREAPVRPAVLRLAALQLLDPAR